ncbi:methyl-accepting chemotaxis protein [Pseudoduganella sp. GCM10020061]|uniref:methyl-accepting chemotaxis protein n=1 Tax=Pseudoduganella sp. GCM10020061 TaxID=3317345 RepID=UPI00362EDA1F
MSIANLKVGTRLALGFGCVCVVLLATIGIGLVELGVIRGGTKLIAEDKWPKIQHQQEALTQVDEIAIALRNMMLNADPADRSVQKKAILAAREDANKALAYLQDKVKSEKGTAKLREIMANREKYLAGQNALIELIEAGQDEEAKAYLKNNLRPVLRAYKLSLEAMIDHEITQINAAAVEADLTYANARNVMIGLGVLALLVSGGVGYVISRSLLKQLGGEPAYAMDIAAEIASGNLGVQVRVAEGDRSSLIHALNEMRAQLATVVQEVRSGTDLINTAASEIAAGNQELSARTEQQASALEETASSMEELTTTVAQNADNARQANQLAMSASGVAKQGGAVVAKVVDTMAAINTSARSIVDIISVIDGIAFQTNILALNAAVEAARAGEQGRGFAVVATEVRTLAQRSAAAAKEIKLLIDTSVENVDAGARLVDQAGATMAEIIESVSRVTDIMSEIAAASTEQQAGIEQINQAVTDMDDVTQQNAALVEEAAAASASMQEQAAALADVVGVFRMESGGRAPRPAAPGHAARVRLPRALPA